MPEGRRLGVRDGLFQLFDLVEKVQQRKRAGFTIQKALRSDVRSFEGGLVPTQTLRLFYFKPFVLLPLTKAPSCRRPVRSAPKRGGLRITTLAPPG